MLARAGITTVEQLRKLGSIEAYVRTKRVNSAVSLNLLWGLESAITGEHWQDVAKKHRTMMCQHFSGHTVTQLFAVFHSLPVTNSHWQNAGVLDYKRPRYIQKSPA
ncbi:TfoX/Sxy family protein (plasmid) [Methylobacter sp. YRD-M1]|nr:TfoX/Sxy family protein [Methylobacter sp. YRD-M1]